MVQVDDKIITSNKNTISKKYDAGYSQYSFALINKKQKTNTLKGTNVRYRYLLIQVFRYFIVWWSI